MSLFDFDDLLDHLLTRRIVVGLAVGIAGAAASHALLDEPLSARVAVLAMAAGVVGGIVAEYRHRHASAP